MSRYVDIEPLENALKAVEKRGEVAVLLDELISVIAKYPTADVQEVVRCKDCKWFGDIGCAIRIVDDSDRPSENDFCSFAER